MHLLKRSGHLLNVVLQSSFVKIGKDLPLDADESSDVFVTDGRPGPSPHCCLFNE